MYYNAPQPVSTPTIVAKGIMFEDIFAFDYGADTVESVYFARDLFSQIFASRVNSRI